MPLLRRGDLINHFTVASVGGGRFDYASVWQRKNLILVTLPQDQSEERREYLSQLIARTPQLRDQNTECVATEERVPGLPCPAAVIADKWGEIIYLREATDVSGLPSVTELSEWIDYVERRCPECEGEAK